MFETIELKSVIKSTSFKYTGEISLFDKVFLYIKKLSREYSNAIYCEFQFYNYISSENKYLPM